jgi:hypothetical protein
MHSCSAFKMIIFSAFKGITHFLRSIPYSISPFIEHLYYAWYHKEIILGIQRWTQSFCLQSLRTSSGNKIHRHVKYFFMFPLGILARTLPSNSRRYVLWFHKSFFLSSRYGIKSTGCACHSSWKHSSLLYCHPIIFP